MPAFKDLTGMRFGRLKVLSRANNQGRRTMWICLCDCGSNTVAGTDPLTRGLTKSCGCLRDEMTAERSITHGATTGRRVPREYRSWLHMKGRCYDHNDPKYPRYGGRGIKVCDCWLNYFGKFLEDMGKCPSGMSIERLDNDGDYEPSNCVWADNHTQSRNRSDNVWLEYKGRKQILFDWARELSMDPKRLHALISYKGKTLQEVIDGQSL